MKSLCINQNVYTLEDICEGKAMPKDDFEASTFDFIKAWQSPQMQFELKTSGSTGKPKPITILRSQMQASADNTVNYLNLTGATHALICINTAYIGGMMMLVRGLAYDWSLYALSPSSNPFRTLQTQLGCSDEALLAHLEGLAFDFAALVPLQMQVLLEDEIDFRPVLNKMQALILGGGAVSPGLEEKINSLSVPVFNTYGMTETVSHIALRRLNDANKANYFEALPQVQLRQDTRGALAIKAPMTLDVWIQTNDLVEMVAENKFIWKGRVDNVINSGGIKLHPEQIEPQIEAVFEELGLKNAFFLDKMADAQLGEKLILLIEGKAFSEEQTSQLKELLSKKLKKYEIPKKIVYLRQFLRTDTEKIQRKVTLQHYQLMD